MSMSGFGRVPEKLGRITGKELVMVGRHSRQVFEICFQSYSLGIEVVSSSI